MPGNANAAECGWLRGVIIGLVAAQIFSPAREAFGGQGQSQIPVSAFVVVSSSIAATLNTTIMPAAAPQTAPGQTAPATPAGAPATANTPAKQICTSIAVSCSGRSPMRVSVDDAADSAEGDSSGDVHECSAQAESTVSLCAAGANCPAGSLGVNIEY